MSDRKIPPVDDLEAFLAILEHARLKRVETIATSDGWSEQDLSSLALYGSACASVRDAIIFRKKFDAT